jgi:hypothetical protein
VGGGFQSAKAKTGPYGLSFGPICANKSANTRGSVCGEIGVVVEAVARCVRPIERGVGFSRQNRKTRRTGSGLVWAGKFQLAYVQGTRTVIFSPDLRP